MEFIHRDPDRHRFLLVGEGESVKDIQAQCKSHGLQQQLIYTGLKQGQACADAYATMGGFLFTSLTDTQGLVLSEAHAARNPVFTLKAPGARDMIRHEHDGFLFHEDTSPAAMGEAIAQTLADEALMTQLRQAAVESAYQVSIPVCTEKLLRVYESLAAQNQNNAADMPFWERLSNRLEAEVELVRGKVGALRNRPW